MLTIEKEGKLPKIVDWRGTCRNCGCVVSCKSYEVLWRQGVAGGERLLWFDVDCPTEGCDHKISVSL